MKPTSINPSFPGILMNFRIPSNLKSDFQEVCRNQHVSMTARLNLMIQDFLKEQETASRFPDPKPERRSEWDTGDAWRDRLHG